MTSVPKWGLLDNIPIQRELQWLVAAILTWLLWKPIRVTINHWRLHRRQRKYPQLVLCRVDKAPTKGPPKSPASTSKRLRNFMVRILHSLVTFVLVLPLKFVQFVMKLWKSHKPNPQSTSTASLPQPISTPTQPPRRLSPPLSVLRKAGSSSSSVHSRVEFAEHSNGHIRTERRYYLPHAQPNQSIQPPNTPSPPTVQSKRSQPDTIFLTPEWPSGRPNPKRQLVPNQKSSNSQNPNMRRDDTQVVAFNPSTTRLLVQTPLSEQMRKRRLDDHMDQSSAKRSSLAGRVTLAGTQARIVASRRTFLNKRDLEAREDRILKDLNTKRIKTKDDTKEIDATPSASFKSTSLPLQQSTAESSSVMGSTSNAYTITPSFTFPAQSTAVGKTTASHDSQNGLSVGTSSASIEPPKEKDTTDTGPIASAEGISLGTSALSSETKTLPPTFQFPASAPSSEKNPNPETQSSTLAQGAAAPSFQFGAPPQSSSLDTPATIAATGFSLGSTSASTDSTNKVSVGPAFQFGAPTPAPSSKEPAPGTVFSFGSASTTASGAQAQFGAVAPAAEAHAPVAGFSFGTASAPAPAFQFGTKDPGIASGAPPPVNGVSFGMAQEPTIPAFNFDSTSTTIPTGVGSAVGGGGASARRRAKAKAGRRR